MRKKTELPNLIGSRRILKDLGQVAERHYVDANAMRRMAKHAKTRADYEYWRTRSIENKDFADQLDAFIDIYRIF